MLVVLVFLDDVFGTVLLAQGVGKTFHNDYGRNLLGLGLGPLPISHKRPRFVASCQKTCDLIQGLLSCWLL
jgi:hypothetical protein